MNKLLPIAAVCLFALTFLGCEDSGSSGHKYKWDNQSSHHIKVVYYFTQSDWNRRQGHAFALHPGEVYKITLDHRIYGYTHEPRNRVYVDYDGKTGMIFRDR